MKAKKKHYILILLLPVQVFIVQLLAYFPEWVEKYYSNGIYIKISTLLRTILGWIPFSVGDLIIFLFVFYLIKFFVSLFKTRFRFFISRFIIATATFSKLYFVFYLFWALNYYRVPLENTLNLTTKGYDNKELVNTTQYLINQLNKTHIQLVTKDSLEVSTTRSIYKLFEVAIETYKELETEFSSFSYHKASLKPSLMSKLQSYNGTTGYINPLTGEAQINQLMPKTSMPTTICHEIAHQVGYAGENEANFIGFLAAQNSKDKLFRYSAYRMAVRYCIFELRKRDPDTFKDLYKTLNKGVLIDFKNSYDFWSQFKNPIEPYIKKGYSTYLKANKQTEGIDSYNYVVDLLISYYQSRI